MVDSEPAGTDAAASAPAESPATSRPTGSERSVGVRTRRTDGGRREESDRLGTELAQLEQDPRAYETRNQAVIDRYERVLAERRERRENESADDERSRLGRLKARLFRLVGRG